MFLFIKFKTSIGTLVFWLDSLAKFEITLSVFKEDSLFTTESLKSESIVIFKNLEINDLFSCIVSFCDKLSSIIWLPKKYFFFLKLAFSIFWRLSSSSKQNIELLKKSKTSDVDWVFWELCWS